MTKAHLDVTAGRAFVLTISAFVLGFLLGLWLGFGPLALPR